ncbi:MAG: hypothetical protein E7627_07435 [Ruminococcaceae bacterium]|nr:hypothetical protein [Oscillospiraceae bacterium]
MSSPKDKNLHADHRKRMRVRFRKNGFSEYHSHEVLEQVLFEVIPRSNTNETGHLLINKFGSIDNVLNASPKKLEKIEGVGPKSAEYLASLFDRGSEIIKEQYRTVNNLSVYQVAFLADWFMSSKDRCIGMIICDADKTFVDFAFLDNKNVRGFSESDWTKYQASLCEEIVSTVGSGTYILVLKSIVFERSFLYRLVDMTKAEGSIMLNAYEMIKRKPVSLIFNK